MKGMTAAMKAGSALVAWEELSITSDESGDEDWVWNSVSDSTGLQPKDIKATVEGIFRLAAEQMKRYRGHGSFELAGMLKLEAYEAKCPKYTKIRFRIWKVGPRVVFVKHVPMAVKATPMKKLIEMVQLKDEFRFVNWV